MSAVSLYYYLQVFKQIYVANPPGNTVAQPCLPVSLITLCLLAALVVVLGCAPDLLLSTITDAIQRAGG